MEELATTSIFAMYLAGRRNMKTTYQVLLVAFILVLCLGIFMGKPDFGPKSATRKSDARGKIEDFTNGLRDFQRDCGRYPTTEEGLVALLRRPSAIPETAWRGPYVTMPFIVADPWRHAFIYECPGLHNTNEYDVYSLGPHGNGGDESIGNWTTPK